MNIDKALQVLERETNIWITTEEGASNSTQTTGAMHTVKDWVATHTAMMERLKLDVKFYESALDHD